MKQFLRALLIIPAIIHSLSANDTNSSQAINSEVSLTKKQESLSYASCGDNCDVQCPQGKRGKRGKRGHRGATGATGASNLTDELFMNAPMITNMTAGTPNTFFSATYGTPTVLEAWELLSPVFTTTLPLGTQFIIPSSLDTTQPVTLTIHCLNIIQEASGSVRLQVQTDYKANGEQLGTSSPSGGYAETILTSPIAITDPTGFAAIRYFTLTVSLNPLLMAGKTWGDIVVTRVLTGNDDDYNASIFLAALSVNYTKVGI